MWCASGGNACWKLLSAIKLRKQCRHLVPFLLRGSIGVPPGRGACRRHRRAERRAHGRWHHSLRRAERVRARHPRNPGAPVPLPVFGAGAYRSPLLEPGCGCFHHAWVIAEPGWGVSPQHRARPSRRWGLRCQTRWQEPACRGRTPAGRFPCSRCARRSIRTRPNS